MSANSINTPTEFMPAIDKPKRYHPALVALHWLIAILIFGAFFLAQGSEGDREHGEGPRGFQPGNPPPQGFGDEAPPQGLPAQEAVRASFQLLGFI